MSKTICLDFDGVIHNYPSFGPVVGGPIVGAFNCIRTLIQTNPIFIMCARPWHGEQGALSGLNYIPTWFDEWGLGIPTFVDTNFEGYWEAKSKILITNRKLPAAVYIDDRGLRFESWPQVMRDLVTTL